MEEITTIQNTTAASNAEIDETCTSLYITRCRRHESRVATGSVWSENSDEWEGMK